jgi:hypothetical protein
MLKSLLERILRSPDDNTGGTSSTPSGDNGQDSPTEQQDDNQGVEEEETSETPESSDSSSETPGDEGDQLQPTQEGELPPDEEAQVEEPPQPETFETAEPVPDAVVDKPGDEKIRFSSHPRWKELVSEKNEFKQQVEQHRPLVEQSNALNQILSQHNIPAPEFQALLQYAILKRQNPQQAFELLRQDYEVLGQLAGQILPPDLQTEVAAATLSPERASEIARARASQRYQQWQQSNQQQYQQSSSQQIVTQSIGSWVQMKQSIDPDLKQGTNLFNQVDLRLRAMPAAQTPQQAYQNCENAYKQAKEDLQKLSNGRSTALKGQVPRRSGQPPSRPSSPTNRLVVKTAADAVKAIMSGGGKAPTNIRYA